MNAKDIIGLIPDELFDFLSLETKVDYQVKKLTGESVFKLILFSMLDSNKLNLRVMERFLESSKFKCFVDNDDLSVKYNSIRDRIIKAQLVANGREIILSPICWRRMLTLSPNYIDRGGR